MRVPIAAEGWPSILTALAVALAGAAAGWWAVAWPAGAFALACVLFFRDPERMAPDLRGAILAPADGKVVDVRPVEDRFVGPSSQVSIFLSPLDVHVNRAPVAGLVSQVEYRKGRFLAAYRPEASEVNERCSVSLQGETLRVVVKQIAGVLARRIVCRVQPGDKLAAGQRYGLIKFGSRVDLVLPREVKLSVRVGDRVRAGESIIGVMA